ncbi:MAG: amidohydrolase [Nocardioides sp.]|nr:amidohydrolase [Nocardioides sp.]
MSTTFPDLGSVSQWQEELYKHLHEHPELSMEETETAAEIARRLEAMGYDVQHVGGGVVGVLGNGDGPSVLFRADIDALPVAEATGLPYSSKVEDVMHACGHDAHIVCALGAAQALAESRDLWAGTYIALFQPAEETAEGGRSMVADGLLDKIPRPDVALAQHVLVAPPAGQVATAAGPVLSAGDSIRITVFGKGSHGSMPHLGVDPVVLASAIVLRLQGIVAREIAPADFGVVTVGSVQAGTKSNIIPDHATLLVNLRAYDLAVRTTMLEAIERIVRGECAAAGSPQEPTFEYYDQFPMTDNDADVDARVRAAFVEHFGADRVQHLPRIPASEDFSVVPDAFGIPYTYWGLGGFTADQTPVPNHNPGFAPAIQPTLATGTEAAIAAALAWLTKE